MKLGKTYFSGSLTFDEGNNFIGPNTSVLTGSLSGSVKGTFEGSFTGDSDTNISGAFDAVSASIASERLKNTTDTLTGDLTVTGIITAQEFHTQYVSASIIYKSGSTQFGDSYDDTHSFTGSLQSIYSANGITGSFRARGGQVDIEGTDADLNFRLDSGSGASLGEIRFWVNQDQLGEINMHKGTGNMIIQNQTQTGYLSLRTGDGAVLNITGSSVGIGTTAPSPKLHLQYSGGSYSTDALSGFINEATTGRGTMRIRSTTDNPAELFFDINGGVQWDMSVRGSSEGHPMRWYPAAGTPSLNNVGTHVLELTQAGKLVVGPGPNAIGMLTLKAYSVDDQDIISISEDSTNSAFAFNANFAGLGATGNTLRLNSYWTDDIISFKGDGNIGIGTSSADGLLHLKDNFSSGIAIILDRTELASVDNLFYAGVSTAGSTATDFMFLGTGTTHLSLTGAGRVGIGVTTPNESLQVNGNIRIQGVGNQLLFDTTGADSSNGIKSINDYETVLFNGRGAAGFAVIGNSNIRFGFGTSYTGTQTNLYIKSDGNVGIGTTSPTATLHVHTSDEIKLHADGTYGYISIGSPGLSGQYPYLRTDSFRSDGSGYFWAFGHETTGGVKSIKMLINDNGNDEVTIIRSLAIRTFTANEFNSSYPSFATGAIIRANDTSYFNGGDVGIGTTLPTSKLQVHGNLSLGQPGNGSNTDGRFISLEGNTDAGGEGSARIFFAEHNSTTAAMDNYGMSIGYRGGATSITGASGNSWTGLSQIGNGEWGMWGHNNDAAGALIMYGDRAATYVNFSGNNVSGIGTLSKSSGTFNIEHPLESKAQTHRLVHSFVESPQANNIYRGRVTLVNGQATVNLDTVSNMTEGTFVALNRDIHSYVSNESDWDAVRSKVEGNILTIECQNTSSTATVTWLVVGERHDTEILQSDITDENGSIIVEPLITDS